MDPANLEKIGVCRVCRGTIVRRTQYARDPYAGLPIIGPGSANQSVRVFDRFCKKCGIKYEFVPGEKKIEQDNVLEIRLKRGRRTC